MIKRFLKFIFIGQAIFITQGGCCCNKKNKSSNNGTQTNPPKPVPPIDPTKVPPVDKHIPPINHEFKGTRIDKPLLNPPTAPEQTLDKLRYEGWHYDPAPNSNYNSLLICCFGMNSKAFQGRKGRYKFFYKYADNNGNEEYIYIFINETLYDQIGVHDKDAKFRKYNDNIYYTSGRKVEDKFYDINKYEADKDLIKFD